VNPFTKKPLTPAYKKILGMRQKLPVYTQMKEFYEMVSPPPSSVRAGGQTSCPQAAAPSRFVPYWQN
jgi:pre-mRNA-splicing factor ATP-dependent RNA helicase DHX15/PRP43